jgi:drug/metabolite transporter (DMT)-like permease
MLPCRSRLFADLSLLLMVAAWGYTFVPIKAVTQAWPAHTMTFVALRFWLATLAFVPLLAHRRRGAHAPARGSLGPGATTGIALLLGYSLQTAGLAHTTPALAGFLTGLSVVMVPLGARWLGKRVHKGAVVGIVIATLGLGLLSFADGMVFSLGRGELLVVGCAVAFAAQILLTDRYAAAVDAVRFTAVQCLVTAAGATAYAAAFEIPAAGWPTLTSHIVYTAVFTGIVCTTLAFLAQTVAQRVVPATHVALIYAMEPVFAALASWWLLGEMLTDQRAAGCGLILLGMLCAELLPVAWRRARASLTAR